jgi:DtxR family Mn-dependent transcriptional regulator
MERGATLHAFSVDSAPFAGPQVHEPQPIAVTAHGEPIPTKEGHLPKHEYQSLLNVEPGRRVRILEVLDDDPEKLRYLGRLGLFPKSEIFVASKGPFNGPVEIKIGNDTHHLGAEVASVIFVQELTKA